MPLANQPTGIGDSTTPNVMSGFLNKDYLYGVHIKLNGDAVAFRWNSLTDVYETILLSTVASNHLDLPLFDLMDTHYALCVGVDDQDNVFIVGNHHELLSNPTTTHMIRCSNVNAFTNPASWSAASTAHYDGLDNRPGADPNGYTYNHFERMTNGTLLHFFSQSDDPGDAQGRDYLAFKRVAGVWSAVRGDGHFATTEDGLPTEADRVYITGLLVEPGGAVGGGDRVHFAGLWRTDNSDANSQQAPFYLYSDNLTTWRYKALPSDGIQSMPITWSTRSNAEINVAPTFSPSGTWSLYVDPTTGFPEVIIRDGDTPSDWVILAWTAGGWTSTLLPAQAGFARDFVFQGEKWRRVHTVGRLGVRRVSDSQLIRMGTAITTSANNFSATHDPVWLRERGIFAICIGDGDEPKVWTLGNGAKAQV